MNNLIQNSSNIDFGEFPGDDISSFSFKNKEKNNVELGNVIPAVPTLYLDDGSIDYEALEDMLEIQSKSGIKTVLIAGTTGESSLLSKSEHLEYIYESVKIAKKYNMNVVAGTGSNNTKEQDYITEEAFNTGISASLLLPPYYLKCSDRDLIVHLSRGLDFGPGIIYSISGRTGMKISVKVLKKLKEHPNFVGVKECDGSDKIEDLKALGIRVWTGNDDEAYKDIHKSKADGTISVVCNIDPYLMLNIQKGIDLTKDKIDRLLKLSNLCFLPGQANPKPIHNIMEMMRKKDGRRVFRSPCGPLDDKQQEYVQRGLKELGYESDCFGDNVEVL